jgi:hypothetical protein
MCPVSNPDPNSVLIAKLSSGTTSEAVVADCLCELTLITRMSASEWSDFLTLPPNAQAICVVTYQAQDWTQKPDVFDKVIAILGILGTVAADVSGVAGAASAIAALKSL